jgi:hypothetical protein
MHAVHEVGHVGGAWLTGGRVARVVLNPLTISRTDLAENSHPLVVVWAGPIIGVLAPLAVWVAAAWVRIPGRYVLRFFAGFCLIANGAYLSAGSFDRIGDCGEMLRQGSPVWHLWLFGAISIPGGLLLWHRQGTYFGIGTGGGKINTRVAYVTLAASLMLLALGLAVNGK